MNSRSAAASTRSRQHAAWTLGRWIAAGALEQADIEDELYMAALHNGLVHDDGQRQTWGTIHSGLGARPAAAHRPGRRRPPRRRLAKRTRER